MQSPVVGVVEPVGQCRGEHRQRAGPAPGQGTGENVADGVFDATLLVGSPDIARIDLEAIVAGKLFIGGVQFRLFVATPGFDDGGLAVVDHHSGGNAAKALEGIPVRLQPVFRSIASPRKNST